MSSFFPCKTGSDTKQPLLLPFKDSFIPKTLKDWNQLDPNILQKSTSAKDPTSTFAEFIRSDHLE
jgi:hypothetical protein